jgi:hypothetical protein
VVAAVGQGLQAVMRSLAETDKEEQVYSPLSLAQPLITQVVAAAAAQRLFHLPVVASVVAELAAVDLLLEVAP